MGRPSDYNDDIATLICARLAEGETLRAICRDDDMPVRSTVHLWLLSCPEFSDQYARARELQAEAWADEIVEISDDARNDWMERHGDEDAGYRVNGEHIQRARLRTDTRKWLMARAAPKKYGDKVAHEHTGANGGAIRTEAKLNLGALSVEQLSNLETILEQAAEPGGSEDGEG